MTLAIPNVRVSGVISTDPTEVLMGDEITLIATIENSGSIALGDIECSFYDGDVEIGSRTVPSKLDPGEEASITGITWTPSTLGDHVVSFRIDPLDRIEETDEEDNIVERTFNFAPDLSIKMVEMDSSFKPGDLAEVRITVENEGNGPLTDGFMISVNMDSKNGDQLVSNPVSEVLDPRISNEHTFDLQFNMPDKSGNLTIFFTVSTQNNDGEDDLSDNWISRDIDLVKNSEKKGIMDYLLYIIIAIVLILVAGAAFYVWKFGLPVAPPPGDAEEPSDQEQPGNPEDIPVSVEPVDGLGEGTQDDDVMEMDLQPAEDEGPVLEMAVIPEAQTTEEPVMVAEVVEVEEIGSYEGESGDEEEEMIPEV